VGASSPASWRRRNPELYKVIFENDRVRVLEYKDGPGDRTKPHGHPYSVRHRRWVNSNAEMRSIKP
jgi:hypothetical protein